MELSQLNTFSVVAKTLHFTRAAEVLRLTQPAVSQQIKSLENELGYQLFFRGKSEIYLTEAGKILQEYTNRVLDNLDEMKVKLNDIDFKIPSSLKVATVTNSINGIVFVVLQRLYRKKYKNFEIQFVSANSSEEVLELLLSREIDIGFLREGVESPNLIQFPFVSTEFSFVVGEKSPLVNKESIDLSELLKEEWILFKKVNGFRIVIDNYFEKIGFQPTTILETNDASFLMEMIKWGNKISLLPNPTIKETNLKIININAPKCSVRMDAAFLRSKENDFYYEFLEAMLESNLEGFVYLYQKKEKERLELVRT